MISEAIIQELSHKIDIIDILSGFINLKRRGANYLGLCPFHNEKTPSFTVSPAKGIYKCFGCGASGNTISFLMQHEKFSFVEAIKWLGKKYNIEIQETGWTGERSNTASLHIINEFAAAYFQKRIASAINYIKKRNISNEMISRFALGFDDGNFSAVAQQHQYSDEITRMAGLVNDKGQDNYRGRLIFPIHNAAGKIAGFGARKLDDSDFGPKYINTQENDAYNKSNILYGLYQASRSISKQDECLLVEGYLDVISLHQEGIDNVVASSGTSLTGGQVRLIKRYTNNLTIIYDGDDAGTKAALRGVDIALEEGLRVKFVILPKDEDPDSYIKSVGVKLFAEYIIGHKKDFVVAQLALLLMDDTDSVKRADVINTICKSIAKMSRPEDYSLREDYIRQCSALLRTDETGLRNLVRSYRTSPDETPPLVLPTDENEIEKNLIRALIEHGDKPWNDEQTAGQYILQEINENSLLDFMTNESYKKLFIEYNDQTNDGVLLGVNDFLYSTNEATCTITATLLAGPEPLSPQWAEQFKGTLDHDLLYRKEIDSLITYIKLHSVKKLIKQNQEDLRKDTINKDQLTMLIKTHQHLKNIEIDLTSQIGATIIKK
jgi:DNA primase